MAATKNYFDQILENQNKMYTTLNKFATAFVESAMPEKKVAEKAGELLNDYYTRSYELVEKMATKEHMEAYQKDFWSNFTADYTKSVELSMDLYKKSAEYFKDMWSGKFFETQQERTKKMAELYQESAKAVYETGTANAKVVQEYMV